MQNQSNHLLLAIRYLGWSNFDVNESFIINFDNFYAFILEILSS